MCSEYVSGELILCFHKADSAAQRLITDIREHQVEHVEYVDSLVEKLRRIQLKPSENLDFEFHLVRVPAGEEQWKINYLQFFYKIKLLTTLPGLNQQVAQKFIKLQSIPDYQFTVVPNSILTLAAGSLNKSNVRARNFSFSNFHNAYKTLINIPTSTPSELTKVNIVIIDSGIANDVTFPIANKRNFVDSSQSFDADDEIGHGTVIAMILNDLCPGSNISVYKVADINGKINEWDILAALAACTGFQVINLSVQFGLEDRICNVCGRESQASRSAVFENLVNQFAKNGDIAILVAAAGNYGANELAFPARFSEVLAIGAINSKTQFWSRSNRGNQYNDSSVPDNHFVCPGGDNTESIGTFGANDTWRGTSFAAAYASGVVANFIARQAAPTSRNGILSLFRSAADPTSLVGYDSRLHGHGILRYAD